MSKSRTRKKRDSRKAPGRIAAGVSSALSIPDVKSIVHHNLKLRWNVNNTTSIDILGSDVAHWCNLVTIPGAYNAIPLYSMYRIKRIIVYAMQVGGKVEAQWPTPAALGGYMLPDPTIVSKAPSQSAYSMTVLKPAPGSLAAGWFEPVLVGTTFVCSMQLTGTTIVDVEFDAAFRYQGPNDSQPGPGPVWIFGTSTPSSIGITGTFACGPLAAAAAALLSPGVGTMIY